MRQPFWFRLDHFARQLFPFALTVALLLASIVLVFAAVVWVLRRQER